MAATAIGLDIGGANLKAATADGWAVTRPFELWKHPQRLAEELSALARELPSDGPVAITMTGELCDCFETKRDGVGQILAAVGVAFGTERVRAWSTAGRFLTVAEAEHATLEVAAANWHALATFAGRLVPDGSALLVDVGSTTTDVIPIADGRPIALGRTDIERMRYRELAYTGARRTPLCALLGSEVAAELFATTLDAYLILKMIAEDPADCDTADGRPATRHHAHARLARMLCGDIESISQEQTRSLARKAFDVQRSRIADAVNAGRGRLPSAPSAAVIAGSGEFLARDAISLALPGLPAGSLISFRERLGPALSTAACAYAVAVLSEWEAR
jgi:(4-(4-[2-(gamma-L-glutamylamino)ethyl]phenoxymethyl)furan-2-yl)methanamine synthase